MTGHLLHLIAGRISPGGTAFARAYKDMLFCRHGKRERHRAFCFSALLFRLPSAVLSNPPLNVATA
jgi:hypothetical protein